MRIDALHRRMTCDVRVLHDAISAVLPIQMPKHLEARAMNITPFIARLNSVSDSLGVFNEIVEDASLTKDTIFMTGLWNPEDQLPENGSSADVRVLWHLNPTTRRIHMTPTKWAKRRYFFWEIVMHEFLHRHQDALRESGETRIFRPQTDQRDLKEEQHYLGDYDEVEAFAHDAALELRTWWYSHSYRQAFKLASDDGGSTVATYLGAFALTPKHPALVAFRRKTRAWYDLMGKRTDFYDWLQLPNVK